MNCDDMNSFINPRGKYSHTSCLLPMNYLSPRCLVTRKSYLYQPLKASGLTRTRQDFPRRVGRAARAQRTSVILRCCCLQVPHGAAVEHWLGAQSSKATKVCPGDTAVAPHTCLLLTNTAVCPLSSLVPSPRRSAAQ